MILGFIGMTFGGILIGVSAVFAADVQTANPNASQDAKQLLAYLASLPSRPDHRVISGQEIASIYNSGGIHSLSYGYKNYVEDLHSQTGQWVGLIGADLGFLKPPFNLQSGFHPPHDNAPDINILIDYWKAGGLITIMINSFRNPWTGTNDKHPGGSLDELLKPGTVVHKRWRAELDQVAADLQPLQDAGVVVLFRPLHEMNGDWFWWGVQGGDPANSAKAYRALWRNMFNYLTKVKKLDNLLWVFSPSGSAPADPRSFYPGNDVVDVIGLDDYEKSGPRLPSYGKLLHLGKPLALAEFGPDGGYIKKHPHGFDFTFLRDSLKSQYNKISYFMIWDRGAGVPYAMSENKNAGTLLHDPMIANREDIQWKQ